MTVKMVWLCTGLLFLTALGVSAHEKNPEAAAQPSATLPVVRPYSPDVYSSTAQFEYEFEWLGGAIEANPQ